MLEKIRSLPLMAFLAIKGFVADLRSDERGLSGVVVTVLLILVAVLAIVLIWGFLDGWLRTLWNDLTTQAAEGLTPQD